MEIWAGFLILAIICFLIGTFVSISNARPAGQRQTGAILPYANPGDVKEMAMSSDNLLPAQWDEASISRELTRLGAQKPSLIPHYIESVKERWILRQDDRTAELRLQFLKRQIEHLKLAKEFQQTVDDIDLLRLEKTKRTKTLELETEDLDTKRKTRSQIDELAAIRERKKLELEIAQLDDQIGKIKSGPATEAKLSPEEERAKRHAASEARLSKLKQEKQKALAVQEEQERVLKVNAIDDEIQREMVEWSKTLP